MNEMNTIENFIYVDEDKNREITTTTIATTKSNFNLNLLSISHRNLLYFPFIYVLIYIFCPSLLNANHFDFRAVQ